MPHSCFLVAEHIRSIELVTFQYLILWVWRMANWLFRCTCVEKAKGLITCHIYCIHMSSVSNLHAYVHKWWTEHTYVTDIFSQCVMVTHIIYSCLPPLKNFVDHDHWADTREKVNRVLSHTGNYQCLPGLSTAGWYREWAWPSLENYRGSSWDFRGSQYSQG